MRSPAGTYAGTAVSVERSADRVHLSPAPRQQCCERTQAGLDACHAGLELTSIELTLDSAE